MELKHSIMLGMMGKIADRFHEYLPHQTLAERLAMTKQVRGVDGIEIVYPGDFENVKETIAMVKDSGLAVSAVNLNVQSQNKWQTGSFTAPDPELRKQAVADMVIAMDLAAELDTTMITCCPLIDGHNYNFQVDYLKQWAWLEEGIATAARHRNDIRISLEYKLNESRNYCILGDMGRTLFLCERLGFPHVGVTMDVGHALIAKESPAEVLTIAAQAKRLFYVHFNDNAREWDWDMLPGSVNLWDLVEMLYYMDRFGWDGWLSYDVATRDGNQTEQMTATIAIVESAMALLDKLGREQIQSFIDEGIPARAFEYLVKSLL
ncbi:MAG: sugar phosphate isomerase/epimerase [Anaerolineales bacterium]|nr:MAG: sugar phosphate isomerase/epimerase [Anaerolineales bacterium]